MNLHELHPGAPPSTGAPPAAGQSGDFSAAVRGLDTSPRLAARRFAWLPVAGPGAVYTSLQGRGPGESTSLAGLGELLSSIAVHGVLTPILVEELANIESGETELRLVTGEGRLRSCRIGLREDPDNSHFQRVPAMICPGPLTDEERNAWQLVENLARQDYQPGELASALMLERCAVLAARLTDAGAPVPVDELDATDDPLVRWSLLEKTRIKHAPQVGAPWELVLRRLGVSFGPRKARQLVAAFQHLPRDLTADLDAHKIALTTRTGLVRLARDPRQDVTELWTAVKALGRPELLAAATAAVESAATSSAASQDSEASALLTPEAAVQAAVQLHDDANASRAEKLSHRGDADAGDGSSADDGEDDRPEVPANIVTAALESMRRLVADLRAGRRTSRYAAGSLNLLLRELSELLAAENSSTTLKEAG